MQELTPSLALASLPLSLLVLWPLSLGLVLVVRGPGGTSRGGRRLALAGGGGTLALALVCAALHARAGSALFEPGLVLAQVGFLDLGISWWLDGGAALAVVALGVAALLTVAGPRRGVTSGKVLLATAGAMVAVLADNFPLALAGWAGVALVGSGWGGGLFAFSRVGDMALLLAMATMFWALGGTWDERGYTPDIRHRFEPSNGRLGEEEQAAHRELSPLREAVYLPADGGAARLAQATPQPLPKERERALEQPLELPPAPRAPGRREGPRQMPSRDEGTGYLTMTTHPGARVYLGLTASEELEANLDIGRCDEREAWDAVGQESQIRSDCVAVAPFVRKRVRPGVKRVAIVPPGGTVVRGDFRRGVASFTLRVAAGEEVSLEAVGPTMTFRRLAAAIAGVDSPWLAPRTLWGISSLSLAAVLAWLGLLAIAGLFPFAWLAQSATGNEAGLFLAVVAPLVAAMLAWRLEPLLLVTPWVGLVASTVALVVAAAVAWRQTDPRRSLAWLSSAAGGFALLAVAAGVAWTAPWTAALSAVCLLAMAITIEAAAGGVPDDLQGFGGLARRAPLAARGSLVAAASLVALPPAAGFWSREITLAATEESSLALAALVAIAGYGIAFAVARLHLLVFSGKRGKRSRAVVASSESLARLATLVAAITVLGGALLLFSSLPFGGGDAPWAATWMRAVELGPRGSTRLVWGLVSLLLLAVGIVTARARYGAGRGGGWREAEQATPLGRLLRLDLPGERLGRAGRRSLSASAAAVATLEGVMLYPVRVAGRRLAASAGPLAATPAGRVALYAACSLLVVGALIYVLP